MTLATRTYGGYPGTLKRLREAWRKIDAGAAEMEALGLPGRAVMREQADRLGASEVQVHVPCLICRRKFPEAFAVSGDTWPNSCICAECNDEIETKIRASHPYWPDVPPEEASQR